MSIKLKIGSYFFVWSKVLILILYIYIYTSNKESLSKAYKIT